MLKDKLITRVLVATFVLWLIGFVSLLPLLAISNLSGGSAVLDRIITIDVLLVAFVLPTIISFASEHVAHDVKS